ANNSSGMCCGTTQNSYKTLSSLAFMLPSGTYIDSAEANVPDMHAACAAVKPFVEHDAASVELLDRASLGSVEGKPGVPDRWKALPENATALLVEFRAPEETSRAAAEQIAQTTLGGLALLEPAQFTRDSVLAAQFWNVRSGLLASVGAARPSGSSFILE